MVNIQSCIHGRHQFCLELTLFTKFTDPLPSDLLYLLFLSNLHLIRKIKGFVCVTAVFALQRKKLGCVNEDRAIQIQP